MHDLSICEQMIVFSSHDIYIMPHGAGFFGILWAPEHSAALEIFPTPGIDWTWLRMLINGLSIDHERADGVHADSVYQASFRAGGQDDWFTVSPKVIFHFLEKRGINVTLPPSKSTRPVDNTTSRHSL